MPLQCDHFKSSCKKLVALRSGQGKPWIAQMSENALPNRERS